LRVPNAFKALAMHVMRYHTHCHRVTELRAATLTDMLANLGAFKVNNTLADFLLACEADAKGRTGLEHIYYPQAEIVKQVALAGASVDIQPVLNSGLKGERIGEAIRHLRIKAVSNMTKNDNPL